MSCSHIQVQSSKHILRAMRTSLRSSSHHHVIFYYYYYYILLLYIIIINILTNCLRK